VSESLTFSRSLYLPEAVQAAADAYGGLATIEVVDEGEDIVATLSDVDSRITELADHFANHVLHETIVRIRTLDEDG
jgi:hypothetical protein